MSTQIHTHARARALGLTCLHCAYPFNGSCQRVECSGKVGNRASRKKEGEQTALDVNYIWDKTTCSGGSCPLYRLRFGFYLYSIPPLWRWQCANLFSIVSFSYFLPSFVVVSCCRIKDYKFSTSATVNT